MNKLLSAVDVETSESVDINLSPLIDMVFLLLIFFMVTTVFVKDRGVDVQKPEAVSGREIETENIVFTITSEGDVVYGGESISVNNVRGLVSRLMQQKERPIILKADKISRTGKVVDVIDQCKLAGAAEISIATEEN